MTAQNFTVLRKIFTPIVSYLYSGLWAAVVICKLSAIKQHFFFLSELCRNILCQHLKFIKISLTSIYGVAFTCCTTFLIRLQKDMNEIFFFGIRNNHVPFQVGSYRIVRPKSHPPKSTMCEGPLGLIQ